MASLYHLLSILLAFVLVDASGIQLPKLPGEYDVGTKRVSITDPRRLDPFATYLKRSIYLQLFYPLSSVANSDGEPSLSSAPWLPFRAAAAVEKEWEIPENILASVETNIYLNGPALFPLETDEGEIPVLVFSPPLGALSAYHTSLLSSLASHGYFIIGVDHPYDSSPLATLDGELILQVTNTSTDRAQAIRVRRDDVYSLAHTIDATVICGWLDASSACDRKADRRQIRLGIFGVGLGADVARLAMQNDNTPYAAAASLDGLFVGQKNEMKKKIRGPLLYLETDVEGRTKKLNREWDLIEGWKLAVKILGTKNGGLLETGKVLMKGGFEGRIDGQRLVEILGEYLNAYWGWVFFGKESELLEGETEKWSEVQWLDMTNNGKRVKSAKELEAEKELDMLLQKKLKEMAAKKGKKDEL